MQKDFFERLKRYYGSVGKVLKGQSELASIFPNSSDVGLSREWIYARFLQNHLPHACRVDLGGFLFNLDGAESKQLDVIITSDICPQFNFHNVGGFGKTFSCVEGTLAVACLKSNLDTAQLEDALNNIASIPKHEDLGTRANPLALIKNYENWPYKIVYASKGISRELLAERLEEFYTRNSNIPFSRRPDIIHVCGEYVFIKLGPEGGTTRDGTIVQPHTFWGQLDPDNVFGLATVVNNIQGALTASRQVIFDYGSIVDKIQIFPN